MNKPSGLFVHRTRLDWSAREHALQRLRGQLDRPVYPGHRLDRATSGALLFALDPDSHRRLSAAFEFGAVDKRYLAIVRGWPADRGCIDHPLRRLSDDGVVLPEDAGLQPSVTHFETLARAELPVAVDRYPTARYALVRLLPRTGRRHQLRRHLKHAGHPIVGDTTYGKGPHNRFFRERFGSDRLLLHAERVALAHPVTGAALAIEAPPTADLAALCAALGWSDAAAAAGRAGAA